MTAKEKVKNDVLLGMESHVDKQTLVILERVLNQTLSGVEVSESETLPATTGDSNAYVWKLFMLRKAPKLSERTVQRYGDVLKHFTGYCNKSFFKVTSMDVEVYLNIISKDNCDTSLDGQRRCLSAFFTWMRKTHLITENPCDEIEPYKIIVKPIDHMEPEEVEQLKTGCKTKRDRAMIEFLRSTAVRVGEAAQIKVSDINWRTGEVSVYGEKSRRYRTTFLDSVAIKFMEEYINERGIPFNSKEAIFTQDRGNKHKGLERESIRAAVYGIRDRAHMERRVYPHLFRKTTATNITRRGGSVQDAGDYIGHKDNSVTARFYAFKGKDHTEEIFRKYVAIV